MINLHTTNDPPRAAQRRVREHAARAQTLRGDNFLHASAGEWMRQRPLYIAPALIIVVSILQIASYPRPRVIGVAIVYSALFVQQTIAARSAYRRAVDDRALLTSWLIDAFCQAASVSLTGGMMSPLWPALFTVWVASFNVFARGAASDRSFAIMSAITVVIALLPASMVGPPVAAPYAQGLTAFALLYTAVLLRSRALRLNDAYQKAGEARDKMREDILSAVAARARSLESIGAKVAHELKNPLSAIKGLVQLLARGASKEKTSERIQVITAEVTRMESILRDYLSFSRPLEDIHPELVATGALADDVIGVLEGRADSCSVNLKRTGQGTLLSADPRRLKEALLNLVANALEATPAGGSVHIELDGRTIRIRDTGKGLSPDSLARVGTPFFTTREGGTGLGVVLARAVILQHGGELSYASELGRGTTVTVALPDQPPRSIVEPSTNSASEEPSSAGKEGTWTKPPSMPHLKRCSICRETDEQDPPGR